MLVIVTAFPAVTSVKNNAIDATTLKTAQASMTGGWIETQKLLASDGTGGDTFGNLVAMDGDYAVIGANHDDQNGVGAGSAYVFVRSGDNWTQQAKLLPSDGAVGDNFGEPAISGNTALICSPADDDMGVNSGSAYIFVRTGSTWTQQAKILPLDGEADDLFGNCLPSLSGDTALIGVPFADDLGADSGAAYVFIRNDTIWTQQAKLLAPDGQAGDLFGFSVYIDDDTALIGAPNDDDKGTNTGSAYIFTRTGDAWSQQQKITASMNTLNDIFGQAIALDGDIALIGAPGYGPNMTQIGAAFIFTRTGVTWTERAMLTASDAQTDDYFSSWAVAVDQNTAIIGSMGDDVFPSNSGSAYVFATTDGIHWTEQQKLVPSDGASGDEFCSVAFKGNSAIITSWHDDDNGINSGSAYVFTKTGLTFSIRGDFGVKAVITNDGTMDVNDIAWQIHVEGGILGMINKTVNGTIDIPAGETVTVSTGMLLGFGAISIIATVAGKEQTAEGTQLIIFSMVKK